MTSVVNLLLARSKKNILFDRSIGRPVPQLRDGTSMYYMWQVYLPASFTLDCAEQGVFVKNADFQNNRAATRGGALGMDPLRKNSLFKVVASTFVSNTAVQTGERRCEHRRDLETLEAR